MPQAVTVLTGGSTPERDVALAGAAQVVAALRSGGHIVRVVDTVSGELSLQQEQDVLVPDVKRTPPDPSVLATMAAAERSIDPASLDAISNADVVFLVLHGELGEGGDLQTQLDDAGVVYTGSDPVGSRLAMDKDAAKQRLREVGVATPDWTTWPTPEDRQRSLGLPLIVKPARAGSTVGLSVIETLRDVEEAVAVAQSVDTLVILEAFLPGRELTVGILDGAALAVGEIIPEHEIFDYECKYTPGMTQEIFPADIDPGLAEEVQRLGEDAHRALGLRDFSRVDFRLNADGRPYCLEANTLPGMTATSLLPQSADASGVTFGDLCEKILGLALRRAGRGNKVHS